MYKGSSHNGAVCELVTVNPLSPRPENSQGKVTKFHFELWKVDNMKKSLTQLTKINTVEGWKKHLGSLISTLVGKIILTLVSLTNRL